jgi:hypothetical protein
MAYHENSCWLIHVKEVRTSDWLDSDGALYTILRYHITPEEEEEEPYLRRMYVCTVPWGCPVPYLPLLFQGVSASDLPTKSISLIPTKDPGTNLFDC